MNKQFLNLSVLCVLVVFFYYNNCHLPCMSARTVIYSVKKKSLVDSEFQVDP